MKKQIALFAALTIASSVAALGQDWAIFQTSGVTIWDNSSGVAGLDPAAAGKISGILLWAPVGTADDLPLVGPGGWGERGIGTVLDQVSTNALSVPSPVAFLNTMLSSGWNIAEDMNNGNAIAVANSGTGTLKGQVSYENGSTFEVNGITGPNGSAIEEIVVAYNSDASSWSTASDYGWSNPFDNTVGTASSDPSAGLSGQTGANQFAVALAPEPTTLALVGLGGLSILFRRRRD